MAKVIVYLREQERSALYELATKEYRAQGSGGPDYSQGIREAWFVGNGRRKSGGKT